LNDLKALFELSEDRCPFESFAILNSDEEVIVDGDAEYDQFLFPRTDSLGSVSMVSTTDDTSGQ